MRGRLRSTSRDFPPTAARSNPGFSLSRLQAPRPTARISPKQAAVAGAAAVVAEQRPDGLPPAVGFIQVDNARRALALAAAKFYPRQPQTIAAVTGTSGKTSVAAFTRQIWSTLGFQSASIGTVGVVVAERRALRLTDDARPGRAAPHARPTGRRGGHASCARGVLARPRPASARRRAHRGGRFHESFARSSRLSPDHRSLSRRQAPSVRGSDRGPAALPLSELTIVMPDRLSMPRASAG